MRTATRLARAAVTVGVTALALTSTAAHAATGGQRVQAERTAGTKSITEQAFGYTCYASPAWYWSAPGGTRLHYVGTGQGVTLTGRKDDLWGVPWVEGRIWGGPDQNVWIDSRVLGICF